MKKIIIPAATFMIVIAVSLIGTGIRSSHDFNDMIGRGSPDEIIFVPGWRNTGVSQHDRADFLKKVFHVHKISVFDWKAQGDVLKFDLVVRSADNYAVLLADKIESFPPGRRKKLVLIGHSFGGRIVIRAMAILRKKGIAVQRGIFLGAAIPDDDPDAGAAMEASSCPNINIFNRGDRTLTGPYSYAEPGKDKQNALGAYGCALPFRHCDLQQFAVRSGSAAPPPHPLPVPANDKSEHDAEFYLERLAEVCREKERNRRSRIESIGKFTKLFWADFFWRLRTDSSGYKIERNLMTGAHRLISPAGLLLCVGSPEQCKEEVSSLRKLDETNSAARINAVKVLQDE